MLPACKIWGHSIHWSQFNASVWYKKKLCCPPLIKEDLFDNNFRQTWALSVCWPHVGDPHSGPREPDGHWHFAFTSVLVGSLPPPAGSLQPGCVGSRSPDQHPLCQHTQQCRLELRKWDLLQQWSSCIRPWSVYTIWGHFTCDRSWYKTCQSNWKG